MALEALEGGALVRIRSIRARPLRPAFQARAAPWLGSSSSSAGTCCAPAKLALQLVPPGQGRRHSLARQQLGDLRAYGGQAAHQRLRDRRYRPRVGQRRPGVGYTQLESAVVEVGSQFPPPRARSRYGPRGIPTWRIEENRWSACRHGIDGRVRRPSQWRAPAGPRPPAFAHRSTRAGGRTARSGGTPGARPQPRGAKRRAATAGGGSGSRSSRCGRNGSRAGSRRIFTGRGAALGRAVGALGAEEGRARDPVAGRPRGWAPCRPALAALFRPGAGCRGHDQSHDPGHPHAAGS